MTQIKIIYPSLVKSRDIQKLKIENINFRIDDLILNTDQFEKKIFNSFGSMAIFENWTINSVKKILKFWKEDFDGKNIANCSAIVSTSATTGIPKLCLYHQESLNAIANAPYKNDFNGYSLFTTLNLSHSYLYPGTILPAIGIAKKFTIDRSLNPLSFIKNIEMSKSDFLITVPAQLRFWTKFNFQLPQIKKIYCAGGPFPKEILENIINRFPRAIIFNNYGSTECGPRIGRKIINSIEDIGIFENFSDQNFINEGNDTFLSSSRLMTNYYGQSSKIDKFRINDNLKITNNIIHVIGRKDDVINFGGKKFSEKFLKDKINEITPNLKFSIDKKSCKIIICTNSDVIFEKTREEVSNALNLEKGYFINVDLKFPQIKK